MYSGQNEALPSMDVGPKETLLSTDGVSNDLFATLEEHEVSR